MLTFISRVLVPVLMILLVVSFLTLGCGDDDDDDDNDNDDATPADDDTVVDGDDDNDNDNDDNDNDDAPPPLWVGALRVDITPDFPVILGGYGMFFLSDIFCRWSDGMHDPIYATAVAIDDGNDAVVQIALDTIGILENDVHLIQRGVSQLTGVDLEHVIVSASHSHATPDTVGIYGVMIPPKTGRLDEFIELMIRGAIRAGVQAYNDRRPAIAKANWGEEASYHLNYLWDTVDDAELDSTMTVLAFYELDGTMIATMTNWGSHPTVLDNKNTKISSDFIGGFYEKMDADLGGVNQFLNGNMGASVRAYNFNDPWELTYHDQYWGNFEDAFGVGYGLAETAQQLLDEAEVLDDVQISFMIDHAVATLRNPLLTIMGALGVVAHDYPAFNESYPIKVVAYRLGPVLVASAPGEVAPNVGLDLREVMNGDYEMIVNVAQDWIGYIMMPDQYRDLRYIEYSFVCAGPDTGPALIAAYERMFGNGAK